MRISFEMFGEEQFSRELVRVGRRGGNAQPVFHVIRDKMIRWNHEQFESEGRRASGGWPDLADSTVASRGSAHPILQDTGALLGAVTEEGNFEITDDFLHFLAPDGDGDPGHYGRFHQGGTSKMPQRRPIEFTTLDRHDITQDLQSWIITGKLR